TPFPRPPRTPSRPSPPSWSATCRRPRPPSSAAGACVGTRASAQTTCSAGPRPSACRTRRPRPAAPGTALRRCWGPAYRAWRRQGRSPGAGRRPPRRRTRVEASPSPAYRMTQERRVALSSRGRRHRCARVLSSTNTTNTSTILCLGSGRF
ncbi:hypothetical protein FA95DRAFT_1567651, partial [Auriscalpium vulgare]